MSERTGRLIDFFENIFCFQMNDYSWLLNFWQIASRWFLVLFGLFRIEFDYSTLLRKPLVRKEPLRGKCADAEVVYVYI
jgi:hypothetical protein